MPAILSSELIYINATDWSYREFHFTLWAFIHPWVVNILRSTSRVTMRMLGDMLRYEEHFDDTPGLKTVLSKKDFSCLPMPLPQLIMRYSDTVQLGRLLSVDNIEQAILHLRNTGELPRLHDHWTRRVNSRKQARTCLKFPEPPFTDIELIIR